MATIPGAKLLAISTPYAKTGVLFEAYKQYFPREDDHALVWVAGTRTMNPTITEALIDRELQNDPDAGRAEWLAHFREDLETAFSLDAIEPCVIPGQVELLPAQDVSYVAFVDPSGGRYDQFTLAVAHTDRENIIIDLLKAWRPPFDPSEVVAHCASILGWYRVRTVTGDAYGGEWPREQFRNNGIEYEVSEKNRSDLYLNLIPIVCSRKVDIAGF